MSDAQSAKIVSIEDLDALPQDTVIEALVRISQLQPDWQCRSFQIAVPASLVRNKLLHSVFDWPLLSQVMPAKQMLGTLLLQQKISDLQMLYKLINDLKCIRLIQQPIFDVKLTVRRSTYDVQVQDDGRIVVNQTPSLVIDVVKPCDIGDANGAAGSQMSVTPERASSRTARGFARDLTAHELPWPSQVLLTIVEHNAEHMQSVSSQTPYVPNEGEIQAMSTESEVRPLSQTTMWNRIWQTLARRFASPIDVACAGLWRHYQRWPAQLYEFLSRV